MKRIGLLTSGGDCQALNAAMRGVVKSLLNSGEQVEIYGFLDGYRGLIYGNFRMLTGKDFSGILTVGGTILGTSRTPFKTIQDPDENGLDKVDAMKAEMAADTDTAVLTPTVSDSKTYKYDSTEFATFISKHADILVNTTQVKEYAEVTISLSIAVPGESETFSATEKLTCIKIDNAWFVMVTE